MIETNEFLGKSLDEAIQSACDYYGVAREKLEIEIINDAKTGIFGLVGAKKATIRASKVRLDSIIKGGGTDETKGKKDSHREKAEKHQVKNEQPKRTAETEDGPADAENTEAAEKQRPRERQPKKNRGAAKDAPTPVSAEPPAEKPVPSKTKNQKPAPAGQRPSRPGKKTAQDKPRPEAQKIIQDSHSSFEVENQDLDIADVTSRGEDLPALVLDESNREHILEEVCRIVSRLTSIIAEDASCEGEFRGDRIVVTIDAPGASGLLVGREGQTLAAIHYLAARMAAKQFGGSLRLSIDTGNYRERQESKLRELAKSLTVKVKTTGKSQSTRVLSAYQRRIIHLALENDPDVQTHSKGEGSQRRVIFQLKKADGGDNRRPGNRGANKPE